MKTLHRYAQLAPVPYTRGLATLARLLRRDFLDIPHSKHVDLTQATYRIPCLDDTVFVEQNGEIELLTASRKGSGRPHLTLTYKKDVDGEHIRLYLGRRTDVGALFHPNGSDLPELTASTLSELLALDVRVPVH